MAVLWIGASAFRTSARVPRRAALRYGNHSRGNHFRFRPRAAWAFTTAALLVMLVPAPVMVLLIVVVVARVVVGRRRAAMVMVAVVPRRRRLARPALRLPDQLGHDLFRSHLSDAAILHPDRVRPPTTDGRHRRVYRQQIRLLPFEALSDDTDSAATTTIDLLRIDTSNRILTWVRGSFLLHDHTIVSAFDYSRLLGLLSLGCCVEGGGVGNGRASFARNSPGLQFRPRACV